MGVKKLQLPEFPQGQSIPRRLYQISLPDSSHLPSEICENIQSIQNLHPDWEYQLFDSDVAERFIQETYGSDLLEIYRSIDPAYLAARSDLLRYLICYAKGGVYLDLKSSTSKPLDTILRSDDVFLVNQWDEFRSLPTGSGGHKEIIHVPGDEYTIWCIASAPGHPFLKAVLEKVVANIQTYNPLSCGVGAQAVLRLTGPIAYTLAIHPIIDNHPHRKIYLDPDEAMSWTIYNSYAGHRTTLGRHYSELDFPIIHGNRLLYGMTVAWNRFCLPVMRWARLSRTP